MRPWLISNTTVRSPFRLREGLLALYDSPLEGDLHGRKQEIAFRDLLGEKGIVKLGNDETYSVSRKWRSALSQLGFLYPEATPEEGVPIGCIDRITPNGLRLIEANTVPAMQECFLRSLVAYVIPSVLESDYSFSSFSPLLHVLKIMLTLNGLVGDSRIDFIEMAIIVEFTNGDDDINKIAEKIIDLRNRRSVSSRKKTFDKLECQRASEIHGYAASTFNDYADVNFRYLKATGLVKNSGRGIVLISEKLILVKELILYTESLRFQENYLTRLCEGAELPTDDKILALKVLNDSVDQLKGRGIDFNLSEKRLSTPADIQIVRYEVEELLNESNELQYANRQVDCWQEIVGYMRILSGEVRSVTTDGDNQIKIPPGESPAYLEWILWRAFLAIDSLRNKPNDARRFKVDQDFFPIGTAPGGGPDLIFEFSDFILVVEVTLLRNSRQEAAEGESVRRHVGVIAEQVIDKPVYGLFIANTVDINTISIFRHGEWYLDEERMRRLDIIPLTLSQFKAYFEALFRIGAVDVLNIRQLLIDCCSLRDHGDASVWRRGINKTLEEKIRLLDQ